MMTSEFDRTTPENYAETINETLQDYALIHIDPDGKILRWSAGASRIFGYQEDEVLGRSFDLLFTPEDRESGRPAQELHKAALTGFSEDERWHLRKDGRRIWVSGTVRTLRNEAGALTGYSKLARDITTQKLADLQRDALLADEQAARLEAERKWKHLEEISENFPALVGLIRLPGQVYVFANKLLRDTVGEQDLIGRSFRDVHPEIGRGVLEILDRVCSSGKVYHATEYPLRDRYYDLVLQPMRSEAGQYEAVLLFALDVTERVGSRRGAERLNRELQLESERLKSEIVERQRAENLAGERAALVEEQAELINLAHDAILALRSDGTIEMWNRGAEVMYGWQEAEVINRPVHELLQTEANRPLHEIHKEVMTEGQWNGELKHTRRDGKVLDVSSRWAVWKRNGKPYGWMEINRDITERKRTESQFREAQKMESLGLLAGGIAHDFNNLLTGIMGNISLAMDMANTDSPLQKILLNSLRASEQAAFLTKQILAYAGKGQFIIQEANLSAVVRDTISLIGSSIPKNVDLRLALTEDLPRIKADITQLQQVAMNLIFNAMEAIGDKPGTIQIVTRDQDDVSRETVYEIGPPAPGRSLVLEVRDTGSGIDPLVRSNIFDPFFSTKFMGRGLGLAAVSGIVRSLNGAIAVDTEPGNGSTFRVFLPIDRTVVESRKAAYPILVVDDEEVVRRTADAILRSRGYQVLVAENGQEAVEKFRELNGQVALVLLDMAMPVMSGEDTFRELKTIRPDVPVLISSGYSEQEAIRRFGGLGVAGFIQKPYTLRALVEKVTAVLGG